MDICKCDICSSGDDSYEPDPDFAYTQMVEDRIIADMEAKEEAK